MKLLATLILTAFALLIVGGFFLAVRAAIRKYRETGSILLEGRPNTQRVPAWRVSWAGVPLIVTGGTTLFKGPPLVGLVLLALGIAIAAANRIQEAKWQRGGN